MKNSRKHEKQHVLRRSSRFSCLFLHVIAMALRWTPGWHKVSPTGARKNDREGAERAKKREKL
jgi:hypothetical protein